MPNTEEAPSISTPPEAQVPVSVPIRGEPDIVVARDAAESLAARLQFTRTQLVELATAISEIAHNILQYAGGGTVAISFEQEGNRQGVGIVASDGGPGIADLTLAMQDGSSTSGGLGLGLPGARRLMDDLRVDSTPGLGTTVSMWKWAP